MSRLTFDIKIYVLQGTTVPSISLMSPVAMHSR